MARTSNLSRRIEQILSEHSFKQAFTGGRVRLLAAALVVPVALVAATAAVRVEAAGQESGPAQQKVVVTTVQDSSAPGQTTVTVQPAKSEDPASKDGTAPKQIQITLSAEDAKALGASSAAGQEKKSLSFTYGQDADGESRAFVTKSNFGPMGSGEVRISGNWDEERQREYRKAQASAHGNGDFLWFTRKGKSYIVDDPAVTAELKKLQEQHAVTLEIVNGFDADKLNALKNIDQAKIDALKNISFKIDSDKVALPPDFSKKMEEINRSLAKLQDRLGSKDVDLAELQKKLSDMQAQLGAMQGKLSVARVEMAQKMSDQAKIISDKASRMANVQVQMPDSKEIDKQVQSIIEQSLKDGKARPVE